MISPMIVLSIAVINNRILAYPKGPGCGALLTNNIVHGTFDGSEPINSSFDVSHALLNSTNAWCPRDSNTLQHLKVTLGKPANLSGLEIQGRSSSNQYLMTFKISYQATEQGSFQLFPSNSNSKVFRSSVSDGDEIAYFPLDETTMKALNFVPFDWNDRICIRMELYGCVPIDGNFTSWSEWSGCSGSCGNGTKIRYRSCSHPAPANGGQDCVGDVLDSTECVGVYCPVDGGFSDWSEWRPCSVSCGSGFQLRSRACNNPFPQNGGKLCEGNRTEGRACKKSNCTGPKDDPTTFNARKSTDEEDDGDKYFIPMLVLAALVVLLIFILVGIVFYVRSENKRRSATISESDENLEKGRSKDSGVN